MEDRGISEIERAAHDYVDARDERMRLGEEEQRRHTKLVAVMKKHGKVKYLHRDGDEMIDISLVAKDPEEKAKVRIKPVDEYKAKPDVDLTNNATDGQGVDTDAEIIDTDQEGGGE